jgi:Txe/YoeB family toxin of Txe-Axe toxin-antitoxin module
MTTTQAITGTTEQLIANYEELDARRINGGHRDGGYMKRRRMIDKIVDELARRADNGDTVADNWLYS